MQGFDVEPSALQTIDVGIGATMPTVAYRATVDGQPRSVAWSLDRGDIGSVAQGPAPQSKFTPNGTVGGVVNVLAVENNMTLQREILVRLNGTQNGPDGDSRETQQMPMTPADLQDGGGVGGVGGDGLGGPVSDQPTLNALMNPTGDGSSLHLVMLYPYDKTVWPRGMQAPLLQWGWDIGDADAIQIELKTTSGSFHWTGTFGRPSILAQTGTPFIRHPIPQDIWDIATNTAGGLAPDGSLDKLTVKLTVAKSGMAYGPLSQTWIVAPARLTGTVYYNSYGTHYVKNWANSDGAWMTQFGGSGTPNTGAPVGAAILGIHSGDAAPTLVVGQDAMNFNANGIPTDDTGCRVCHVVSSKGRWLITQSEQGSPGDGLSFLYDLTQNPVQGSAVTLAQQGTFAWAAMTSDGSYALTNTIDPSSSNPALTNGAGGTAESSFYQFGPTPTAASLTLPNPTSAGYPSYSPDDTQVAYIDVQGSTNNVTGPIVVASYDASTQTFGAPATLLTPGAPTPPNTDDRFGYPVFLPDNSGILFEREVRRGGDNVIVTRNGARSELWWLKLDGTVPANAAPLAALNGKANGATYLPLGANHHGLPDGATPVNDVRDPYNADDAAGTFDDTTLNYEPTVLPIVAGGYAWVVFTSRREYGNTLTTPPYQSWPPDYPTQQLAYATTKKVWVAAIDLNAPAGSDPSHPAFYLPAQELLAGNSRGFWVLDPCKMDGASCETGDQCCNGYCEPNGQGGALVCSNMPPNNMCSGPQEKCASSADCCDPTDQCINGFCAQIGPH